MKKMTSKALIILLYIIFSVVITIFFTRIANEYRKKPTIGGEWAPLFFTPVGVSLILKTKRKRRAARPADNDAEYLQNVKFHDQPSENYRDHRNEFNEYIN
jgi:hypothetical protein